MNYLDAWGHVPHELPARRYDRRALTKEERAAILEQYDADPAIYLDEVQMMSEWRRCLHRGVVGDAGGEVGFVVGVGHVGPEQERVDLRERTHEAGL